MPVIGLNAPEADVSAQIPPGSAPESNVLISTDDPAVLQIAAVLSAPAKTSC